MEFTGSSIDETRASDGKRKAQKKENPKVLEILSDNKLTFNKLTEWYCNLQSVKRLATYERTQICLKNFNMTFGDTRIIDLCMTDLEDYQIKRENEGMAKASIDLETGIASTMVNKAFDTDKISGDVLKPFRRIKKVQRKGTNARKRTISFQEYLKLIEVAQDYLKPIIVFAINTGMRRGEILNLKWSNVDRAAGLIRLTEQDTKEGREKVVPLNHHAKKVLDGIIPHVHHDFVFTCNHKPMYRVTRNLATCCKYAGIPYGRKQKNGITFHDIRRTVKTNMLEAGIDKVYRDTILGHSLEGMDTFYMQPSEDNLINAMEKYTSWFDGQLKNANVDQTVDQKYKNRAI
jgi:integrase